MKRLLIVLMLTVMLLSLAACKKTTTSSLPGAADAAPAEAAAPAEEAAPAAEEAPTEAPAEEPAEAVLPGEEAPAFNGDAKFMPCGDNAFMVLWYTEDQAKIAMETPAAGKYVLVHLADTMPIDMAEMNEMASTYFGIRDANGNEHALAGVLTDPAFNSDLPRYSIDLVFDVPADMAAIGMTLLGFEGASGTIIVKLVDIEAK